MSDWLDQRLPLLHRRAAGFASIWHELAGRGRPLRIVETGCVREDGNWAGDGQSTLVWDALVAKTGGTVASVDIDPAATAIADSLTSDRVTVYPADSLAFLAGLDPEPIVDLLYLDSYDIDWADPGPSMRHHLAEIETAYPLLGPGSIVAVDDNAEGVGKGLLVGLYLVRRGWTPLVTSYVRAWIHP